MMNASKFLTALLLLGIAGSGPAWADHGHHSRLGIGVVIGPGYGPWYYPPPYYYPPYYPPVVMERQAPVYVEQAAAPPPAPAPAPSNYWYYCASGKGYYPYVTECPGGWQKVSPQPQ